MAETGLLTISELAKYTRATRDTLLHYDRVGLVTPVSRGENNYRIYSFNQVVIVNVIRSLQRLGMSLDEIKEIKDRRTPGLNQEVLEHQIEKIDEKIEEWVRARKLIIMLREMIQSVSNIDESKVIIQHMPAQAIVLGGLNDYSNNRIYMDAFLDFYNDMSKKSPNLDANYPVWAVYTKEQIRQRNYDEPNRFYFYNPEGHDKKPAGLYAIGHISGGYTRADELFDKIVKYIDENGYEIYGDAYEEYPLNEACISDSDNYYVRVMISVREKSVTVNTSLGGTVSYSVSKA